MAPPLGAVGNFQAAQFFREPELRTRQAAGAPGRFRTSTVLPPPDFESGASTSSATGALGADRAAIIAAEVRGSMSQGFALSCRLTGLWIDRTAPRRYAI